MVQTRWWHSSKVLYRAEWGRAWQEQAGADRWGWMRWIEVRRVADQCMGSDRVGAAAHAGWLGAADCGGM